MSSRELRKALLDRVDKHDGHWYWTGTVSGVRKVPVVVINYKRYPARKLAWEVFKATPAPERVQSACGEVCIKPECLVAYYHGCQDPTHTADKQGICNECRLAYRKRDRWTCDCGRRILKNNRWKHLQTCNGIAPSARSTPLHSIQDCVDDFRNGITLDRICKLYSTTPQALERAYYRALKKGMSPHPSFAQACSRTKERQAAKAAYGATLL